MGPEASLAAKTHSLARVVEVWEGLTTVGPFWHWGLEKKSAEGLKLHPDIWWPIVGGISMVSFHAQNLREQWANGDRSIQWEHPGDTVISWKWHRVQHCRLFMQKCQTCRSFQTAPVFQHRYCNQLHGWKMIDFVRLCFSSCPLGIQYFSAFT